MHDISSRSLNAAMSRQWRRATACTTMTARSICVVWMVFPRSYSCKTPRPDLEEPSARADRSQPALHASEYELPREVTYSCRLIRSRTTRHALGEGAHRGRNGPRVHTILAALVAFRVRNGTDPHIQTLRVTQASVSNRQRVLTLAVTHATDTLSISH